MSNLEERQEGHTGGDLSDDGLDFVHDVLPRQATAVMSRVTPHGMPQVILTLHPTPYTPHPDMSGHAACMPREILPAGKMEGCGGRHTANLFGLFVLLVRLHHSGAVCFNIEVPALQHLHEYASHVAHACSMVLLRTGVWHTHCLQAQGCSPVRPDRPSVDKHKAGFWHTDGLAPSGSRAT